WGEEAFAKAIAEDKPIFLSIGYSTCHWCHVMERESFEDQEVADILNEHYVAIKVDREERPDVDHIYMNVCQALTGQGGWPLTVLMTGDKQPFFAGTYFPKHATYGRTGVVELLIAVVERWHKDKAELIAYGGNMVNALQEEQHKRNFSKALTPELLEVGFRQLSQSFEPEYGGFSYAPKFPTPHNMMYLLRYWRRTKNGEALSMVEHTLTAMRRGGIYDHLGYGFARYSTDNQWLAPHFEKMLYDNALLCEVYLEAYQCTGNADFARVAEEILTYVMRDMTSPDGGFYSAQDADSEGIEGKYYIFTRAEVLQVLGEKDGTLFADYYGITAAGNFEQGASILHTIRTNLDEFAESHGFGSEQFEVLLEEWRSQLLAKRSRRIPPYKDDKILTAWNALMIAALAKATRVLGKAEYIERARKALDFVYARLMRSDGRLLARYREGEAAHLAYLDDYAFLLRALIDLYEATFEPQYIARAVEAAKDLTRLFWDEKQGGFYFAGADAEKLIMRPKELYDGAMPSGNSVAALALMQLADITGNSDFEELAEREIASFSGEVEKFPRAYTYFLMALDYRWSARRQIVVAGPPEETTEMLTEVGKYFLPDSVVLFNDAEQAMVAALMPHIADKTSLDGAAAYICENYACQPPVCGMEGLLDKLLEIQ
ncbi:MAG: thioredoxin domain-containing protein, partial [Pelosinus sp.]|nr:thioredoxin domain-containing protein [Pelosinus sp.]